MAGDLLKLEQIAKSFSQEQNSIEVLKGVDFVLSSGDVVSIVGASGSGKSTLLHIMGSLDHPSSGKISYKDKDLLRMDGESLSSWRNHVIGFVFQFHHLLPELTVLENALIIFNWLSALSAKEEAKRQIKIAYPPDKTISNKFK